MDPKDRVREYFETCPAGVLQRDALCTGDPATSPMSVRLQPDTLDKENRTVDVVWFTGIEVARYDWRHDEMYTLSFDPAGVDLSLLNNGAPLCDSHSSWSVRNQLGKVEKAWVDGKKYLGKLRFSRRPDVDGVWMDVQDGIVSKFSMGVEILEIEDQKRKEGQPLKRIATSWRPFELSAVPIPADFGTTTLSRAGEQRPQVTASLVAARERTLAVLRLRGDLVNR